MKDDEKTGENAGLIGQGGSMEPPVPPLPSADELRIEARYQRRALVLGVMQAAPHLSLQGLKVHVAGLEDFIAEAGAESDG